MRKAVLFFCFSILMYSCGNKKAKEGRIISNDKMQAVMWDILQAEAFTDIYLKKDSSKNILLQNAALQNKIFELHQISKEDFYRSFDYYSAHAGDMRTLLDSVSAKAERQRNKVIEKRYSPAKKEK